MGGLGELLSVKSICLLLISIIYPIGKLVLTGWEKMNKKRRKKKL